MKDLTPNSNSNDPSVVAFPMRRNPQDGQYYETVDGSYVEEDEINLRDLWRVLIRRRWVVLIFFLIAVCATVIATFLSTPIYRASLTLQINRDMPKVLDYQEVNSSESVYEKDFYQTQYELLKSRSLAKRVIEQLALHKHVLYKGKDNNENDSLQQRLLTDRFLSNLTVEPVKRSRLVKIHFDSADPILAARVSNTVANNFINLNLERRFDASSYAKTFIEDRLRQVKASLEDSEKALIKFARENEIINVDANQPIIVRQLQQVNSALAKSEAGRIKSEALYQEMLKTKGQGLNKILDSSVIQQLKQLKAELDSEYQQNLKIYKTSYPTMLQLQGRIDEVQNKIEDEIENIRSAIYSSFKTQQREETILLAKLSDLKEQVLSLQDRSIQYKVLKRETDTNKSLYQGLLQRMKEVGVAGGISTNNITIIDIAETPISAHKPNLKLNTLLAMIFGLIGGVFLAFFFEYFDDTIKSPEDMEKHVQLPVLGLVPEQKQLLSPESDQHVAVSLLSHHDPRSAIAEAYRSTRTALQFSTSSGAPKVLLITSASPGEGKTTSAMNIAIAFSQMSKKVLLIDTDLRNPSIHNEFGKDNSSGLTNYLAGNAKPLDITFHTSVPGLFMMPTGPLPPNPAELLTSSKMKELLDTARDKFEYIIMDGPPVMGLADALVLADIADGTAIVVESGSTRNEHLQAALKRLQASHATIVGGILSKFSSQGSGYDYYHDYYSYNRDDDSGDNKQVNHDSDLTAKQLRSS